jgi:hypothetical protein
MGVPTMMMGDDAVMSEQCQFICASKRELHAQNIHSKIQNYSRVKTTKKIKRDTDDGLTIFNMTHVKSNHTMTPNLKKQQNSLHHHNNIFASIFLKSNYNQICKSLLA